MAVWSRHGDEQETADFAPLENDTTGPDSSFNYEAQGQRGKTWNADDSVPSRCSELGLALDQGQ